MTLLGPFQLLAVILWFCNSSFLLWHLTWEQRQVRRLLWSPALEQEALQGREEQGGEPAVVRELQPQQRGGCPAEPSQGGTQPHTWPWQGAQHHQQPHCSTPPSLLAFMVYWASQPFGDILCWMSPWFGEGRGPIRQLGLCRLNHPRLTRWRTSLHSETWGREGEWGGISLKCPLLLQTSSVNPSTLAVPFPLLTMKKPEWKLRWHK